MHCRKPNVTREFVPFESRDSCGGVGLRRVSHLLFIQGSKHALSINVGAIFCYYALYLGPLSILVEAELKGEPIRHQWCYLDID